MTARPDVDTDLARLQQEAVSVAKTTGLEVEVFKQQDRYGVTISGPTGRTSTGGHTWQQTWTLLYGARLAAKYTPATHHREATQ